MKKIFQILVLTILSACSTDEDNSFEEKLSGQYQITAIRSEVGFDMNNDGIKTEDIYNEISDKYNTIDGQSVSFYNFSYHESSLEIKSGTKLIRFAIPDQYIDALTNGTSFLGMYVNSAYIYSYEYDPSKKTITLINKSGNSIDNNIVLGMEILENGQLKLQMRKKIFDFVDATWTETTLTLTYSKIL